jgi:hypothetical protein
LSALFVFVSHFDASVPIQPEPPIINTFVIDSISLLLSQ